MRSDEWNVVAVIHARGGSKRVPMKNIKPLGGRPLISYVVRAALKSRHLRRTIVSTDHPEIKRLSLEYGAEVPFDRPRDLSEDVPSELVTQHACRFVEAQDGKSLDAVVTLQPTTPFCRGEDIDRCIELLFESGADSVISAREVKDDRPEWMYRLVDGWAISYQGLVFKGDLGVSQRLEPLYRPNGGIWVTRRDVLMHDGLILGPKCKMQVMPFERSIDIDEPIDFVIAEAVGREYGLFDG